MSGEIGGNILNPLIDKAGLVPMENPTQSSHVSIDPETQTRFTTDSVDVNLLHQSLTNINNFAKRKHHEKLPPVLMYEMTSDGKSEYQSRTLRELLNYVNIEAKTIDSQSNSNSKRFSEDIIEHSAVSELRLRDLRRLDYQFNPNEEKSVLVRRHAVLFAMDPLRAVVMANKIILIVPDGADSLLSILDQYMKEWNDVEDKTIPFESHAYEALLTTIKSLDTQEFTSINKTVHDLLGFFKSGSLLPIEIQEKTRNLKNILSIMSSRVHTSINVLQDLTEDDEEMSLMNLTYLSKKPKLYTYPLVPEILATHDEMEELLESYLIDCNSLEAKIMHLRSQIQSAEELVSLRLDTSRNELLIANTALAVLACSIGFGAYITGVFGMNLDNVDALQPVSHLFVIVAVTSCATIGLLFVGIMSYLRRSGMMPAIPSRETRRTPSAWDGLGE